MNRFKLSIVLRAGLVALLLMMTTGALAKPTKISPGDDNPGTTDDLSKSDGFFGWGISYSGCFDKDKYCNDIFELELGEAWDEGSAESFKLNSAYADAACKAVSKASALSATIFFGGGHLDLNRHGKNGSMHHIELNAGMLSSSALIVKAGALAEAYAEGDSWVKAGAAGLESMCEGSYWDFPFLVTYCEWALAEGLATANGEAEAGAMANGWAEAGGSGVAGLDLFNGVWAANIEKYVTVVAGGASNYVWADTSANAAAVAEAYVDAALETYIEICEGDVYLLFGFLPAGFDGYCDEGFGAAYAKAISEAEAYAHARGKALAATHTSTKFKAVYINKDGLNDVAFFGAEGDLETPAYTTVSCSSYAN